MYSISVTKIIEQLHLTNLTPEIDTDEVMVEQSDINRPALQLAGFYDHFENDRIQIMGNVEFAYLEQQGEEKASEIMGTLLAHKLPGIVICRNHEIPENVRQMAVDNGVPLLSTSITTCDFMASVIRFLKAELAPRISIHGVLVDVNGEGVLIMGESGIGKSEAALELIKRGHRLISDDVVEIRKVSDSVLEGSAPDITRHFIELRGIGIIDVKTLYGVQSVKDKQEINLCIKLEEWNKDQEYDRLGLDEQYTEFLGNKIVCHQIPIRPGRNLEIIVESAAVNYRQKQMGYNAARELYNRVTNNMMGK